MNNPDHWLPRQMVRILYQISWRIDNYMDMWCWVSVWANNLSCIDWTARIPHGIRIFLHGNYLGPTNLSLTNGYKEIDLWIWHLDKRIRNTRSHWLIWNSQTKSQPLDPKNLTKPTITIPQRTQATSVPTQMKYINHITQNIFILCQHHHS